MILLSAPKSGECFCYKSFRDYFLTAFEQSSDCDAVEECVFNQCIFDDLPAYLCL